MYQVTRCRCRARPLYPSRRGRDFFWVLTGHFLWTLSTCFIGTVHFKSFYHSTHIIYRVHIQYIHIYISYIYNWLIFQPSIFCGLSNLFLDQHRPSPSINNFLQASQQRKCGQDSTCRWAERQALKPWLCTVYVIFILYMVSIRWIMSYIYI